MLLSLLSLAHTPLALAETLHSGQAFHWQAHGPGFVGAIGVTACYLEQQGDALRYAGPRETEVRHYLALDHPLAEILASFPNDDPWLAQALAHAPGLRILRQPRWESLASFLTSSLKQVAHISQISLRLRQRFGHALAWDGPAIHAYPTPLALAEAGEAALRECGLGYRAKSVWRAAKAIVAGEIDLEALAALPDEEAHAALCRLHGVGDKIARCVLLFGYERLASFPIDVWVERVLTQVYRQQEPWPRAAMLAWAAEHFGPYAGYAQQYLFHYARRKAKELFAA